MSLCARSKYRSGPAARARKGLAVELGATRLLITLLVFRTHHPFLALDGPGAYLIRRDAGSKLGLRAIPYGSDKRQTQQNPGGCSGVLSVALRRPMAKKGKAIDLPRG